LTFFIKLNPQYNNIIKHTFINQNNIILDISDKNNNIYEIFLIFFLLRKDKIIYTV